MRSELALVVRVNCVQRGARATRAHRASPMMEHRDAPLSVACRRER